MPQNEDYGRDRSRDNPYDQGGSASYRELMKVQREIEARVSIMERELGKELEALRSTVNEMKAGTRWVRHLAQIILTVFGTAIGGGLLYLLKLPGGPPGGSP